MSEVSGKGVVVNPLVDEFNRENGELFVGADGIDPKSLEGTYSTGGK